MHRHTQSSMFGPKLSAVSIKPPADCLITDELSTSAYEIDTIKDLLYNYLGSINPLSLKNSRNNPVEESIFLDDLSSAEGPIHTPLQSNSKAPGILNRKPTNKKPHKQPPKRIKVIFPSNMSKHIKHIRKVSYTPANISNEFNTSTDNYKDLSQRKETIKIHSVQKNYNRNGQLGFLESKSESSESTMYSQLNATKTFVFPFQRRNCSCTSLKNSSLPNKDALMIMQENRPVRVLAPTNFLFGVQTDYITKEGAKVLKAISANHKSIKNKVCIIENLEEDIALTQKLSTTPPNLKTTSKH